MVKYQSLAKTNDHLFKNSAFNTMLTKAPWEAANVLLIPGCITQRVRELTKSHKVSKLKARIFARSVLFALISLLIALSSFLLPLLSNTKVSGKSFPMSYYSPSHLKSEKMDKHWFSTYYEPIISNYLITVTYVPMIF